MEVLSEFRVCEISMHPNGDDAIRRCTRVLGMVHELHKAGYQRLRIAPFIHDIGTWRCPVTFARNVSSEDGMPIDWALAPQYSSAAGEEYFDWKDAAGLSARQLAQRFLDRFRQIAEMGVGQDWAYAGWFCSVLGLAESSGVLPLLRGHASNDRCVLVPLPPTVVTIR